MFLTVTVAEVVVGPPDKLNAPTPMGLVTLRALVTPLMLITLIPESA